MRIFNIPFENRRAAIEKAPEYAAILDVGGTLYTFTSHADPGFTGNVDTGTLQVPRSIGQRLSPQDFRATIGSLDVQVVDVSGQVTIELARLLDVALEPGAATLELYAGFNGLPILNWEPIVTQQVVRISGGNGTYKFHCADATWLAKRKIFTLERAQLRASFTSSATTIPVVDCSAFQQVNHGPSYSDAPSTNNVGYIRFGDEIIRYTGRDTATPGAHAFTGCVRGSFNTPPAAYQHDPSREPEQVTEFVYLELSVVQLALALYTGYVNATTTLPSTWHAGLDRLQNIHEVAWLNIGTDLWDPLDEAAGLVVRIFGVGEVDAKTFVERELFPIAGVYSPVRAEGTITLRRLNSINQDSPAIFTLDESNVVSVGELRYVPEEVRNRYKIRWHWNGDRTTRTTEFLDSDSITRYGDRDPITVELRALHGSRHTAATLVSIKNQLRERLANAPIRFNLRAKSEALALEPGDPVRVRLGAVRDWIESYVDAATIPTLDRVFEVQQTRIDWRTFEVDLELFASSRRPGPTSDCAEVSVLANSYYTAEGTELVANGANIDGNDILQSDHTLTGGTDLTDAGSIYYYDGDLTIAAGVTLTVEENVQLRIRGTLTVNGTIDGSPNGAGGGGLAGVSSTAVDGLHAPYSATSLRDSVLGNVGYIGATQGGRSTLEPEPFTSTGLVFQIRRAPVTDSGRSSVEVFQLVNGSTTLTGLPTELRGTSGGPGQIHYDGDTVESQEGFREYGGGTGGPGGAGLLVICRGMTFGVAGDVNLDGGAGSAVSPPDVRRGGGAGGAGGALLVLLDGSLVPVPTFDSTTFSSAQGTNATARPELEQDLSATAFRVQYIPCPDVPADDRPHLASPFDPIVETLDGLTGPQEERTHVTVSGKIAINLCLRLLTAGSGVFTDQAVLTIERKLTSEAATAYTTIATIDEFDPRYNRRIDSNMDLIMGVTAVFFDRDLVPESYDYRFTVDYDVDSTATAIPAGELEVDSWDC